MKKYFWILFFAIVCTCSLLPLSSYYGLSGLQFIPAARNGVVGVTELGLSSLAQTAEELDIFPYTLRGCYAFPGGIEIGFTNTYQYYIRYDQKFPGIVVPAPGEGKGFVADISNTVAPIIPSIKFAFLDEAVPNGSLAVGFEYPYGIFLLFDYNLVFATDFSLYSVVGLSTTTATLYALAGIMLDLPFVPISLTIEGAFGGRTELLTSAQEAFVACGLLYEITERMELDFVFRLDADNIRRLSFGFNVTI